MPGSLEDDLCFFVSCQGRRISVAAVEATPDNGLGDDITLIEADSDQEEASAIALVLREALLLLAVGLALGLPVSIALAHYVRGQLYGVHFADPTSLGLAVLCLAAAAALAAFIPARRASRVDPNQALRYE